ncbi:A/G-specific adenine glycosylase [Candidatus Uhrbacteria bacterium]|nr:MAG: A/G-specific adenine glycosylase [Candidatus Uhrbacteria bacterium]
MNWAPLFRWYEREQRDLPWRRTRDPYRILVSEIMLQQTQVSRVLEFYRRWLKRFPTWRALARASNTDVIHAWAGLGYNRRALVLRDIAKRITELRTKNLEPRTSREWIKLKGIGPYTANALACFAFREHTIPIDTNIRRVLGRSLLGKTFPTLADDARIERAALKTWPTDDRACDLPQALFDLAVAVCTKSPACAACPMKSQCKAAPKFLGGRVRIPKRSIKKSNETKHRNKPFPDRIYRGRILAELRKQNGILIAKIGSCIDPAYDSKRDADWMRAMIERMSKDGLARISGRYVRLPR